MNASGIDAAVSGYVLAGGSSSRLGRDKVLLPFPLTGGTLLGNAIAKLQRVCETVSVCGDRLDLREHLPPSIEIIPDAIARCGPLGGIVAALEGSQTDWNLLLAVDLPMVPVEFLQRLIASATDSRSSTSPTFCILPRVNNLPQPLCGLYHRLLVAGLRLALEEGKYRIMDALHHTAKQVAPAEPPPALAGRDGSHSMSPDAVFGIRDLDVNMFTAPHPNVPNPKDWFLNINTEADLRRARELAHDSGL